MTICWIFIILHWFSITLRFSVWWMKNFCNASRSASGRRTKRDAKRREIKFHPSSLTFDGIRGTFSVRGPLCTRRWQYNARDHGPQRILHPWKIEVKCELSVRTGAVASSLSNIVLQFYLQVSNNYPSEKEKSLGFNQMKI